MQVLTVTITFKAFCLGQGDTDSKDLKVSTTQPLPSRGQNYKKESSALLKVKSTVFGHTLQVCEGRYKGCEREQDWWAVGRADAN